VLKTFQHAIDQYGLPSRVRGDQGGENKDVSVFMIMTRCQDRFSSTILLGSPGMQGTNEEVSPDTSRC